MFVSKEQKQGANMKIKLTKKRLLTNLIFGLIWVGLGIISVLTDDEIRWSDYWYLVIGILYIAHYMYDLTNQYLTIENGTIRKNGLYGFGKKINLNDIIWIEKVAGVYTLNTEQSQLKINTDLIDKDSLTELNKILAELNLPSEETPPTNKTA